MNETLHIYTRVSTSTQEDEGTSLETQKDLGIRKAKELGFEYRVWNEGGQSSSKDDLENRPVLVELLSLIDAGDVNHLFVYNTDRLSRNEHTWSLIRLKLVKNDVTLHTSQGVYLLSDPMNKLLLGIMSEISAYDNSIRTERSRLGKVSRVRRGFWLGGPPPFGYRIVDKKLVENPDESKWIRLIFERYRDGSPVRDIKQELLTNGVKTRRNKPVWSLGSIEKVLSNTHYAGYYYYTDKKTDDSIRVSCPPIMSPTLFKEVQETRERRTRQTRTTESNQFHFYLLRDFLFCGHCGSRYSGRRYEKQNRSVYYCPRRERNYVNEGTDRVQKCSNRRYLKIDETDDLVWESVTKVLSASHLFKEEVKNQVLGENQTHEDQFETIRKLERKRASLKKQISEVTESIVSLETDRIIKQRDPKEVERILQNVEKYKIELESQFEEVEGQIHRVTSKEQWVDWMSQFGDRIDRLSELTPEEKHAFLQGIVEKITVETLDTQTHRLLIRFKLPYVNDSLAWYDEKNKTRGYEIEEGEKDISVDIDSGHTLPFLKAT